MEAYKMKILMTTDPLGGVWNYSLRLSRSLQAYGVQVHLASMGAPLTEGQRKEVREISNVVFYESTYKLEWMHDPWIDVDKAVLWLDDIHRKVKPDLIHFNNYGQVDHDWKCPVLTVFHSCVFSWWRAVKNKGPEGEQWQRYKRRVRNALYASDMLIAPSRSILEEAGRIYSIPENSLSIYNGCEESSFPEVHKEPIIFSMGRIWDESKNMKALEKLAAAIKWPIYLAGDNIDPVSGEEIRIANVHFLGKLCPAAVKEWLAKSAIYIQPSFYEPFGLSVLEAAQARCMLILNDIGTFRELWGEAACFINFRDHEKLVEKVNSVIDNQYLRDRMAVSAKSRGQNYDVKQMTEKYMQIYRQLTNRDLQNTYASKTIIEEI